MAPRVIAAARHEGVLTDEQADRALASLTAAVEPQTAFTLVSIFGFVAGKPADSFAPSLPTEGTSDIP